MSRSASERSVLGHGRVYRGAERLAGWSTIKAHPDAARQRRWLKLTTRVLKTSASGRCRSAASQQPADGVYFGCSKPHPAAARITERGLTRDLAANRLGVAG